MNLSRSPTRFAGVSMAIIVINILLFIFELSRGVSLMSPDTGDMINWGANVAALSLTGDAWRLFSSMFLHIGLIHILFNMYMLFAFGPVVERMFGSARFTLIYLWSGLFGSLVSAMYHGAQMQVVVAAGASGALMGISGAFVGHWMVSNVRGVSQEALSMRGPLAQTIGLNLVLGFINPGVDNACHMGGLISGVILGAAFSLGDFEHSRVKRFAASAVISIASLGVIWFVLQRPPSNWLVQVGEQIRARAVSAGEV
jgi:rhomboid protease GluP